MPLHKLQADDFSNRETVTQITMFMATMALLYGATLIQGGDPIWHSDDYDTANLLPGSPESWGIILLCGGSLMMYGMLRGRRRTYLVGNWIAICWNLFFSLAFLRESIESRFIDKAESPLGFGAFVTYLGISGIFLLLVNTYRGKNALPENTATITAPHQRRRGPVAFSLQPVIHNLRYLPWRYRKLFD